jgi:CAAD domains of cyanobacterial aminoacyl-tRNA synthetase/Zinc finger found in FPG and IleRS
MEPKPNPDDRTSASESIQIGELLDRIVEFLAEAPSILAYGWNSYRRPIVNLAIVLALLSAILAMFDFIGSVNHLIFFPTLFTVLGIVQALRFSYRNVLFAKDRQKLLQQVRSVKQEFLGSSSVAGLLESNIAIDVKAIAVEEPLTLEAISQQEEVAIPLEEIVPPAIDPPIQDSATVSEEPVTETAVPEDPEPPMIATEALIDSIVPEVEAVTMEAELSSETTSEEPETVAETASAEAEETSVVEEEASIPETIAIETPTVALVAESTPSQPEDLEHKDATTLKETTADHSEATVEEKTPAKFLGFEKKTPKESPKEKVAKTEELATEKTNLSETNLTVEETETEASGQENLNPIAPQSFSLDDLLFSTNGVDELRYLFISSQVELINSPEQLKGITYSQQSETLGIGVVNAEGEKCERCWNYSRFVGRSIQHPTLCDRCIGALTSKF